MRQLRDDTHLILDGEVRVYRRERSKRWQAAFVIDGHTIRISTGKRDLADAKKQTKSRIAKAIAAPQIPKPNLQQPQTTANSTASGMPSAVSSSTSQADYDRLKAHGAQGPISGS